MHTLVKRLIDDDLNDCDDDNWHLFDQFDGDTLRILCTGEVIDSDSNMEIETKQVKRGGITCNKCLDTVKVYKSIKL